MTGPKPMDPAVRFFSKVTKQENCWLWTACRYTTGYGKFSVKNPNVAGPRWIPVPAHRWSYEYAKGPIPDGLQIDHICRVRSCVNPDHLRAVTSKQNHENTVAWPTNNSSGLRGVTWHKHSRSWHVQVQHNGKKHSGGYFKDLGEAERAAIALRNQLFTHNDTDRQAVVA
jgi:hypothetical protein